MRLEREQRAGKSNKFGWKIRLVRKRLSAGAVCRQLRVSSSSSAKSDMFILPESSHCLKDIPPLLDYCKAAGKESSRDLPVFALISDNLVSRPTFDSKLQCLIRQGIMVYHRLSCQATGIAGCHYADTQDDKFARREDCGRPQMVNSSANHCTVSSPS